MIYLIAVSIIWSLSFSLIKGSLTNVDPTFVAFSRLTISMLVFLPFLKLKQLSGKLIFHFLLIGAIQYGLMYVVYIYSYQFLKAYEIAILTIFTPIFVVIIYDFWTKEFVIRHWIKATLAIVGAAIIVLSNSIEIGVWLGIILVLLSNMFFAFGQVYYKRLMEKTTSLDQKSIFAVIFLGAVLVSGVFSLFLTNYSSLTITSSQWLSLLYLGVIASGVGFFFWNFGATKVEAGTLAVMNNLKIPLGVLFSIILLNESVNYFQLLIGSTVIIFALFIKKNN